MYSPLYACFMLSTGDAAYLKQLADNASALRDAVTLRDEAIRMALTENGAGVGELVRITGLTRARIYQIRDNRR